MEFNEYIRVNELDFLLIFLCVGYDVGLFFEVGCLVVVDFGVNLVVLV